MVNQKVHDSFRDTVVATALAAAVETGKTNISTVARDSGHRTAYRLFPHSRASQLEPAATAIAHTLQIPVRPSHTQISGNCEMSQLQCRLQPAFCSDCERQCRLKSVLRNNMNSPLHLRRFTVSIHRLQNFGAGEAISVAKFLPPVGFSQQRICRVDNARFPFASDYRELVAGRGADNHPELVNDIRIVFAQLGRMDRPCARSWMRTLFCDCVDD